MIGGLNIIIHVTILILVDGFLQSSYNNTFGIIDTRHNPYFSRWFSAINHSLIKIFNKYNVTILILVDGFLQLSLLYLTEP